MTTAGRLRCCDAWGWVFVDPRNLRVVRPCPTCNPDVHTRWVAGLYLPEMPEHWRLAA